ncbi:MAG: asparagine synthase-related protein [Candidatus Asgardarchaeia archaeon]
MGSILFLSYKDKIIPPEFVSNAIKRVLHRGSKNFVLIDDGMNVEYFKDFMSLKEYIQHKKSKSFTIMGSNSDVKNKNVFSEEDHLILFNGILYYSNGGMDFKNYAEVLSNYIERRKGGRISDILKQLTLFSEDVEGAYSCVLFVGDRVFFFRDPIGLEPLWIGSDHEKIVVSSERKPIWWMGLKTNPLLPTHLISIRDQKHLEAYPDNFSPIKRKLGPNFKDFSEEGLLRVVRRSVLKRYPNDGNVGLLFSGGVDSTIIAKILMDEGCVFKPICVGLEGSQDVEFTRYISEKMGIDTDFVPEPKEDEIRKYVEEIIYLIEDYNPVKVNVAVVNLIALKYASSKGIRFMYSGTGSENVFAGYKKHLDYLKFGYEVIQRSLLREIEELWYTDLYRENTLFSAYDIIPFFPFLDRILISFSMNIDPRLKIDSSYKKIILRKVAERLGIPKECAWRKKKAAQYGSGVKKLLDDIAYSEGYKHTIDYYYSLYKKIIRRECREEMR